MLKNAHKDSSVSSSFCRLVLISTSLISLSQFLNRWATPRHLSPCLLLVILHLLTFFERLRVLTFPGGFPRNSFLGNPFSLDTCFAVSSALCSSHIWRYRRATVKKTVASKISTLIICLRCQVLKEQEALSFALKLLCIK